MCDGVVTFRCSGACVWGASSREECTRLLTVRVTGLRPFSGRVPVVAALHGAVVGGGLELASASHIRVADDSTFYALPEGTRGIFVGGGGSVRIPKLIGAARMWSRWF